MTIAEICTCSDVFACSHLQSYPACSHLQSYPQVLRWMATRARAEKRRRLHDLVGISGISDSGLAQIIESLRRNALDEPVTRHHCHQAALDSVRRSDCTLSLPLITGGSWSWHYLLPQTILKEALEGSHAVAEAYRDALARCPNSSRSPWKMIWYFDELLEFFL